MIIWVNTACLVITSCPSQLWLAKVVFLCSPNSTKQNLLEELDGIQSDLTALKLKNEELKVNQQDYSQEVCSIFCYLLGNRVINVLRKNGSRCLEYDQSLNTEDRVFKVELCCLVLLSPIISCLTMLLLFWPLDFSLQYCTYSWLSNHGAQKDQRVLLLVLVVTIIMFRWTI